MEGIRRDTEAAELAERQLQESKGAVITGPESREALKDAGAETMPQAATLGEEIARRKAIMAAMDPMGRREREFSARLQNSETRGRRGVHGGASDRRCECVA